MGEKTAGEKKLERPIENPGGETEMVKVTFRQTYVGSYGVYHKKNTYTLPRNIAKILQNDIDHPDDEKTT
jgi:hypothetical protein